jgi:hypothetical protein
VLQYDFGIAVTSLPVGFLAFVSRASEESLSQRPV